MYHSHTTAALCSREQRPGHIHAPINVGEQRAGTRPKLQTPSALLSWHQFGPTTISQQSALTPHSYIDTDPWWLKIILFRKVAALQAKAGSQMKRRRAQYKQLDDAKV